MSIFDNRQYISFLSPPEAGTQLAIVIEDFSFNNVFTFAVSGVLTTDNEVQLANKTCNQINTFLVQHGIYFNGQPTYVDLPPIQQYIATRTDHCICVWGQSNFTISASGNLTGSIIHTNNAPTLMTVSDIKELAPMKGVSLEDDDGDILTDNQIAILSKLASAKLIMFTNNPIVLSYNIEELCTGWWYGVRLKRTPVVNFYPPQSRRPIAFNLFSSVTYSTVPGNFIMESDGYLTYKYAQNLVDYPEVYDWMNDVLIVYLSGYNQIPQDIENVIMDIIPLIQAAVPIGVEKYKGGSFEVTFKGFQEYMDALMLTIRSYWLSS